MTKVQRLCSIVMSLILCVMLFFFRNPLQFYDNLYMRFPLYRYLQRKAEEAFTQADSDTSEEIIVKNAEFLEQQIREENTEKESTQVEETENLQPAEKQEEPQNNALMEAAARRLPQPVVDLSMEGLADYHYLCSEFFIVDADTRTNPQQLNAQKFLEKDLSMKKNSSHPQILIYHSHSQETFADSRNGVEEDTIVGVGSYLTEILRGTYGYQVIHIKEQFDLAGGVMDRSSAYDYAREHIENVLAEHPSIEVVIDLHRDGVAEDRHLVTEINGKDTAQIMFYNGLSYTVNYGYVDYLPNPYIEDNLAFSFQLEYQAALYYPEFYRGIYLAGLRYNLHLRPRALLLEAGAQTNTVQEVKNAMEPFADILYRVLEGTG